MNKTHESSKKVDQTQQKLNDRKKPFNPFEGRDKEEVWKEIRKNGTSMSQPEMIKQLRTIAAEQKRKNESA